MGHSLFNFRLVPTLIILLLLCLNMVVGQVSPKIEIERHPNALINETSSYLLDHAYIPVQWNPWSEALLQQAKEQDKLIIVSIGYSSCHWCHVMAKETFEDEAVAQIMNANFINVKVDREERPDIDQLYMTAVQLIKGQGGWPLNVILLPNGKPLYGGTYHTKYQWIKVIEQLNKLYENDPEKASGFADKITQGIKDVNIIDSSTNAGFATKIELGESVNEWKKSWDVEWGGIRGEEKFMLPENLSFLMDYSILIKDSATLDYVKTTLDKLMRGGIYDHVEGGFFRYSTDPFWKVPHFEKMLYDNAQLISLYSKAYRIFKDEDYKKVAIATIAFLERTMRNEEGAFYATMDADSDGKEGAFYLWKKSELERIITTDFNLFQEYFTITKDAVLGNENYVLFKKLSDEEFAKKFNLKMELLLQLKQKWNTALVEARKLKIAPSIDKKIITSWNALMINGYTEAYRSFEDQAYLESAQKTMEFIKKHLYADKKLVHSVVDNTRNDNGFIEDYAFLIDAFINLYSISFDTSDLNFATALTAQANELFLDKISGLYTFTDNEKLILPILKIDDGVIASPNAVMANNLIKLGHLLYDIDYLDHADRMLKTIQPKLLSNPNNYTLWGSLLLKKIFSYYEVAVVGEASHKFALELFNTYIPNRLVVGTTQKSDLPLFQDRYVEGATYIYVCQNSTCQLPVLSPQEALKQMVN